VEYLVDDHFAHPVTELISRLSPGFNALKSKPDSGALDFIRGNLFDRNRMRPLPPNLPGFDNDLNEKIDAVVQRAMATENSLIYAFGQRWGPEKNKKDKYFGFKPGNGVHDIHMNQGNSKNYTKDDGIWQDGGVLIHFPTQHQWVGIFLKFQSQTSQTWHTDDQNGHAIGAPLPVGTVPPGVAPVPLAPVGGQGVPTGEEPHGLVRIVGALVNSIQSPEIETVTLLNTSPQSINLTGWQLKDKMKNGMPLSGSLAAGQTVQVKVQAPMQLSNKGGIITVLDADGLKIDGVSYTNAQADNPGWTIVF
jgi:uncharacterized protein YukJ